ncbi:MAG: transposase [Holosporales bacterium]
MFLLRELEPGQAVVLDHTRFHKSKRTQELIEQVGCRLLFLPPDSPEGHQISFEKPTL